jgi:hypothetical protein
MSEREDYADNDLPPSKAVGFVPMLVMIGPWIVVVGAIVAVIVLATRMH